MTINQPRRTGVAVEAEIATTSAVVRRRAVCRGRHRAGRSGALVGAQRYIIILAPLLPTFASILAPAEVNGLVALLGLSAARARQGPR